VFPLSYAFPDELIVADVPNKDRVWAEVIPGFRETYRFGPGQQADYFEQYRRARFAFTWRKGGWDCLRHYEILANGCVPVFRGLDSCPAATLASFPKTLVLEAMRDLLPWSESKAALYDHYVARMLRHAREGLTCSALARSFLERFQLPPATPRILVLRCHRSVNYTREMLLIGLKRMQECVEFPRVPYLYDDYPIERLGECAGNGFGYARLLSAPPHPWTRRAIRDSIRAREWDLIVYGKMGVGERRQGTVPRCPFWADVSAVYAPEEIAFLYGGDACQDRSDPGSPHTVHLRSHSELGRCFVRELV
jgi:hypothetical protein